MEMVEIVFDGSKLSIAPADDSRFSERLLLSMSICAWKFWSPRKAESMRKCADNEVGGAYLWLNWFSENEIMHFEEKSRPDGQVYCWNWSDVSVGKNKEF